MTKRIWIGALLMAFVALTMTAHARWATRAMRPARWPRTSSGWRSRCTAAASSIAAIPSSLSWGSTAVPGIPVQRSDVTRTARLSPDRRAAFCKALAAQVLGARFMRWLSLWRRANGLDDENRRALEDWVRLRFQLAASDPMIAIIGAVGRLTDAGMTADDAMARVLRILNEELADESAPP